MARRSKRIIGLQRVLGVSALFSTAYGNVGSSIYYALGLVAAFGLGATPLVFVIAGAIFALTALTYAEGTTMYPEAGGSSSFARRAFNEVASFGAGWAQMLNYVITMAISAYFVPHYLGVFWEPLRGAPWDVIGGVIVVALLAAINIVGVKEAAGLNVFLAVADFLTQVLLMVVGAILLLNPEQILTSIDFGVAPTWSDFIRSIALAMIAYTGIETISNMAEETADAAKRVPRAIVLVVIAVFVIYAGLPAVALSALPVTEQPDGSFSTLLGTEYKSDPVLGIVDGLAATALFSGLPLLVAGLKIFIGVLAATILIIATNAGIIGVSRLTYSMGEYRQLPRLLRRVHRRFNTPYLAISLFSVVAVAVLLVPIEGGAKADFLGNIYAFGAMLSFSVAHLAIIVLRFKAPDVLRPYRGFPNLNFRGVSLPLFAIAGLAGTLFAFFGVVAFQPLATAIGVFWMAVGMLLYLYYRRSHRLSLTETVKMEAAPVVEFADIEFNNILVPVTPELPKDAMVLAGQLASERAANVDALAIIEVPMNLPLDARLYNERIASIDMLETVSLMGEEYGVKVNPIMYTARHAGKAIVAEALKRKSDAVVMHAPLKRRFADRLFGHTIDYVLRNAPTTVVLITSKNSEPLHQQSPPPPTTPKPTS